MVFDSKQCWENKRKVLAGELDLSVMELWPVIYCMLFAIHDPRDDKALIEECLALLKILLQKVDEDDDEEVDILFEALYNLLYYAPTEEVLDLVAEAGISFTELRYRRGELTTIRDFLLTKRFSLTLAEKMAQLGVDLNEAIVKDRTPAFLLVHSRSSSWRYKGARRTDESDEQDEAYARMVEKYFSVESMEALSADGSSAAHWTVRRYACATLAAMLKKGVNVNLTEDEPAEAGTTLLHVACEYGAPDMVQLLMEAGADDTLKNVKEETAAHIAVSRKNFAIKISNEVRADMIRALDHVDIPGKDDRTPLMLAQDYDLHASSTLTPVFVEKGADINRADSAGNTALLLHLRWCCFKDVVKAMVNAGYDVNARNKEGDTALHLAVKNRSGEMARYLIKKGADYNIANEKQVTPLQMAVELGLDEVLPLMGLYS